MRFIGRGTEFLRLSHFGLVRFASQPRDCGGHRARGFAISLAAVAIPLLALPSAALAAGTATFSATETIPVPPVSSFAASGGGDGWAVAMSPTQVFNVFHHQPQLTVACHEQSDASPCWAPETITDADGNNFSTSGQPGLWLDQSTGKLYVFATRVSDGTGGVVCIDTTQAATNSDPFCGFTELTAVGDAPLSSDYAISNISDPAVAGSDWYAFNYVNGAAESGTENQLLCFNLQTLAACGGQPFSLGIGNAIVSDSSYPPPAVAEIGSRVIVPVTVGGNDELECFDANSQSGCGGSWPVQLGFSYDSTAGAPYPMLSPSGTITGLCLPTGADPCYDLTGASVSTPAGMTDAITQTAGWDGPAFVLGPRVYVANGNTEQVDCYDYSAAASCTNFPLTLNNLGLLYTVNRDPQRPTCIWVNSDNGSSQIQNFDAYTGGACGQGPIRVLASSIVAPGQQCVPSTYISLQVTSPGRDAYSSGTVQFQDTDGNPLSGLPTDNLDDTGSVALSGLSLNTALGLPEFLITLNGAQGTPTSVIVKLTWTGTDDPSCAQPGIDVSPTGGSTTSTSAVVFVSGLDSSQAFSDPNSFSKGCKTGTWAKLAGGLAAQLADYRVFDAPADDGKSHTADCHGTQYNAPAAFHLDTRDYSDDDTDGTILLGFLGWLHVHYGINDVWLVGHSYGGIWSRSALTQLTAGDHPIVHIDGLITVGTPHTGSFGADLYSTAASTCADALFSDAARIACGTAVGVRAVFGNAINGLTHNALTAWNASQTQQASWGCVPIATMAGTEFSPPYVTGLGPRSYVTPNDVIVGELSADGNGPGSSITRLIQLLHTPMVHIKVPFSNAPVETSYSVVAQTILQTLEHPPAYEARCPGKAVSTDATRSVGAAAIASSVTTSAKHRSYTVTLAGLESLQTSGSRLPKMSAGTILLANSPTTVRCGKKPAAAEPLLGLSKFRVIFTPRCKQALTANFAHGKRGLAAMIHSHARATITLLGKGNLAITTHGLPARQAAVTLILTRSSTKVVRKLKTRRRTTVHVKVGSYQLQIVTRTARTALVGTIPLRVT